MSDTQPIDRAPECPSSESNVVDLAAYRNARSAAVERAEDDLLTPEGRRKARADADDAVYRNLIEQEFLALSGDDLAQNMERCKLAIRVLEFERRVLDDLSDVPNVVRREIRELLPAIQNTCKMYLEHILSENPRALEPSRLGKPRSACSARSSRKRAQASARSQRA